MRNYGVILRNIGVMHPQVFGQRIAAFLRGEHPQKTAQSVEAITGIPARTVAKWLEGASSPSGSAYHRLIKAYGAEIFVHVSPNASPSELRDAARVQRQRRLEQRADAIREQLVDIREGRL